MNEMKYRNYILIIWLLASTVACYFTYTRFYNIHRGCDITSMNDEWEHQSMAVNYAKGYGVFKLGAYTSIREYHLDTYDFTLPILRKLMMNPVEYYHRTCGFSVITGTLYRLTGTSPFNLRVFNFFLIILSWLIICLGFYGIKKEISFFRILLALLPVFILINFNYIDLIGDDTLVIFSLSLVFLSLVLWLKKVTPLTTFIVLIALLFSIFIKSTLLFIPVFLLIFSIITRKKKFIISGFLINLVFFLLLIICSDKVNEMHLAYKYPPRKQLHDNLMNSKWTAADTMFVTENHMHYKNPIKFDFEIYKTVTSFLFERQFYTKRKFLLSGQSLYLIIDGNNEACMSNVEKHIGSWKPFWKINTASYYYHYNGEGSAYKEVIKFYLHKPWIFPFIMFRKLFASYNWNYLFLLLSAVQFYLCLLFYRRPAGVKSFISLGAASILLHVILHLAYLTPLITVLFCYTFYYIRKQIILKDKESHIFFYLPYFFIFYFMFLTLLVFGLNRYTCIANGMMLASICFNIILIKKEMKTYLIETSS
ncbi:MAG: hypothetical protein JWN78_1232 [Bacteroidota bacterium]|nr:hypothetical protein [Bacteroidota bacterium]